MRRVRIAHLSDPHFGTVEARVERALLTQLHSLGPHAVVVTGDITQRARRGQFFSARAFFERLRPVPALVVPGNHDIPLFNLPARLFTPYFAYRGYLGVPLESSLRIGHVELFALNSTSRWRHVQGHLPLRRLPAAPEGRGTIRIAAFHHPLDCASPGDEKNLLRNGPAALRALSRSGFDLVLGGHIHDSHVSLSDTRYPGSCPALILATAGTCLSWRTRLNSPNSFHLVETAGAEDTDLKISRYELSSEGAFRCAAEQVFCRREAGGWNYLDNDTEPRIESEIP